jgi:excisionase family DNA binding protein
MHYTLGEAAKRTGLSKPTIQRAIKSGKLSANRNEDGSYAIDPAEFERVYGSLSVTGNDQDHETEHVTAVSSNETVRLEVQVKSLLENLSRLEREREREREQLVDQIEDLRRRLDSEGEERRRLTALLTDQREKPAAEREQNRRGWRGFLHRIPQT